MVTLLSDKAQNCQTAHLHNSDIKPFSELEDVSQGLSYDTSFSGFGASCKAATPQSTAQQLEDKSISKNL